MPLSVAVIPEIRCRSHRAQPDAPILLNERSSVYQQIPGLLRSTDAADTSGLGCLASVVRVVCRTQQLIDRFGGQRRFPHEADGRADLDQVDELVLGVGRDKDDPSGTRARVVDELSRHVEAAVFAEIDVEQCHVGVEVGRASQRLGTRRGNADDPDALLLQQGAGGVEKARVVVDDQAAQSHEIMLGPRCACGHCG